MVMTRFDKRKARLQKAQEEVKRELLSHIRNNRSSMFWRKNTTTQSLARACRIAMTMGSNPAFIEDMRIAAEIFEEAENYKSGWVDTEREK